MNVFREIEPVEIQFKTSQSIEDCRKKQLPSSKITVGK